MSRTMPRTNTTGSSRRTRNAITSNRLAEKAASGRLFLLRLYAGKLDELRIFLLLGLRELREGLRRFTRGRIHFEALCRQEFRTQLRIGEKALRHFPVQALRHRARRGSGRAEPEPRHHQRDVEPGFLV